MIGKKIIHLKDFVCHVLFLSKFVTYNALSLFQLLEIMVLAHVEFRKSQSKLMNRWQLVVLKFSTTLKVEEV